MSLCRSPEDVTELVTELEINNFIPQPNQRNYFPKNIKRNLKISLDILQIITASVEFKLISKKKNTNYALPERSNILAKRVV